MNLFEISVTKNGLRDVYAVAGENETNAMVTLKQYLSKLDKDGFYKDVSYTVVTCPYNVMWVDN